MLYQYRGGGVNEGVADEGQEPGFAGQTNKKPHSERLQGRRYLSDTPKNSGGALARPLRRALPLFTHDICHARCVEAVGYSTNQARQERVLGLY